MRNIKNFFQHHLNPLHVYCRLRNAGMHCTTAQRMSLIYEKVFYNLLLK